MRYLVLFLITLGVCFLYWALYGFPLTGIDDAQIYFVYFKNFAEGQGFIYNYNGERVEGFTSLLWTLIGSAAYAITPQHFAYILLGLNVLLCYGTFVLFDKGVRLIWGSASLYPLIFFMGYVLLVPGYLEWNFLALLETGLWTFLITACTVVLLQLQTSSRYVYLLSLLVALLVVTRPESMLWGAFMIVMLLLVQLLQQGKYMIRPAVTLASVFFVTLVGLVLFRLSYFGYPLPNTYYAKVSGNIVMNLFGGARYLFLVMVDLPFLWLFLLASVLSMIVLAVKLYRHLMHKEAFSLVYGNQLILAAASLLSFLIPLYTGGDHFGMARMLQPFIPLYFLMIFNVPFWSDVIGFRVPKVSTVQAAVLLAAFFPFFYFGSDFALHRLPKEESPIAAEMRIARVGNTDAEKLNELFSRIQKPVVGVSAAGGFAWVYEGPVFDLLGLNNVAMAHAERAHGGVKNHAAFDLKTLLEVRPEVFHGYAHGSAVTSKFLLSVEDAFQPLEQEGFRDKFVNQIFKGVFYDPAFVAAYKPAVVYHPDQPALIYQSYFSTAFIEQLKQAGYYVNVL